MDREELRRQLLATFKVQLEEHVATLNKGLLEIEKELPEGEKEELLKELFRAAHSVKGSARAVELRDVETLSHKMEDVFGALKRAELTPTPHLVDRLLKATDMLTEAMELQLQGSELPYEARGAVMNDLNAVLEGKGEAKEEGRRTKGEDGKRKREEPRVKKEEQKEKPETPRVKDEGGTEIEGQIKWEVETYSDETEKPQAAAPASPKRQEAPQEPIEKKEDKEKRPSASRPKAGQVITGETIRVSTDKLDALMAGMGELLVSRMRMEQRVGEVQTLQNAFSIWEKEWRMVKSRFRAMQHRADTDPDMDALMDFFRLNEDHLKNIGRKMTRVSDQMEGDYRHLTLLTDDMQDRVRQVRMVPVATLFDLFPRMIRDIGREKGKQVQLNVVGANTEIDRHVLEGLKDPLTHLLRNAVDHGIESSRKREKLGKPEQGTIRLSASQKGNHIVIEVGDDGAGIQLSSVKRAAVRKNLITSEEAEKLGTKGTLDLIFQSGLSTHTEVTDISGRGVGMDVVRDQLEKLHGQIKIDTTPDQGTTFILILPLTLATSYVLLLEVAEQTVAVPTTSVERILHLEPEKIGRMEGKPAVSINGQALPLISMARVLELPSREDTEDGPEKIPVVVLGAVEKRLAFEVEKFLGNQEVVVKNLGAQLNRVRHIAGATILGTGQVVMILNAGSMINAAHASTTGKTIRKPKKEKKVARKVLVVDDSITTRTLERNILENVGYQVTQSADGVEGWEAMQNDSFDAVVFDVEMPRMDGFQLTEKVRQDSRFEHLPVILVTSRESPQDKIRGMEAGADAYITKGTFDQQELLETIERLIG